MNYSLGPGYLNSQLLWMNRDKSLEADKQLILKSSHSGRHKICDLISPVARCFQEDRSWMCRPLPPPSAPESSPAPRLPN